MRSLKLWMFLGIVFVFSACQQKPTQLHAEQPILAGVNSNITADKIKALKPVILDARSPFDFNLSHVPNAINVNWQDFAQLEPSHKGLLQVDLFALARRLSLWGISPESKVVVLGDGINGHGEEGRVAWTLQRLGIKEVYTLVHSSFRALNPKEDSVLVKNVPIWKPEGDDSLDISKDQFKSLITDSSSQGAVSGKARRMALGGGPSGLMEKSDYKLFKKNQSELQEKLIILDVRSPEEFKAGSLAQDKRVKAPVLNLEWKEFFSENGQPNQQVSRRLNGQGMNQENVILLISNHGLRSAAVAYALRNLGYNQAVSFSGGYEEWNLR